MKTSKIQFIMIGALALFTSCGERETEQSKNETTEINQDGGEEIVVFDPLCNVTDSLLDSLSLEELMDVNARHHFNEIQSALFTEDVSKSYAMIQPDDLNETIYFIVQLPKNKELLKLNIAKGTGCQRSYTGFNFITDTVSRNNPITYSFDLSLSGYSYWQDEKRLIVFVDGNVKKVAVSKTSNEPTKIDDE